MSQVKKEVKQVTKKVTKKESEKIDLNQLSEAIKSSVKDKKEINKESIYIYKESELNKAQSKLENFNNSLIEKVPTNVKDNKGNIIFKDVTREVLTSEKRKLKLSFHLSFARTKIRSEFEKLIINYFEVVGKNKLSDKENKELINLTFIPFFTERFAKFKKDEKIYSDLFCNVNNSLQKKVDLICKIYNS